MLFQRFHFHPQRVNAVTTTPQRHNLRERTPNVGNRVLNYIRDRLEKGNKCMLTANLSVLCDNPRV